MVINPSEPPKGVVTRKEISTTEMITQCNEAVKRMSNKNPHKMLIFNCALVIRQLVDRLAEADGLRGEERKQIQ